MAYQVKGRDPLFDSNMQAAIEKRGRELGGIALIFLGLMAAAMIGSYTPDDPSWLSATDAPVQNWLGRLGASIAAPLFMIVGLGSWGLALVLLVWGVRFALHRGDERALSRVVFAPIWIALASVYAAGLTTGPEWTHSFGLGGLFGDMMMGTALGILPLSAGFGLKLLTVLLGGGLLALGAFVLGFTKPELQNIARFLLVGLIMSYASLLNVLGRGAGGAMAAAHKAQAAHSDRRARRAEEAAEAEAWAATRYGDTEAVNDYDPDDYDPEPPVQAQRQVSRVRRAAPPPLELEPEEPELLDEDDAYAYAQMQAWQQPAAPAVQAPAPRPAPEPAKKPGLLARITRRAEPEPEPYDDEVELLPIEPDNGEDRIRAKILHAVKSRKRPAMPSFGGASRTEDPSKPLTKGRGRGPAPLIYKPTQLLRAEPPLTAAQAAQALPAEPPLTASRGAVPGTRSVPPAPEHVAAQPGYARTSGPAPFTHAEDPYEADPRADMQGYDDYRDFDDYGDEAPESFHAQPAPARRDLARDDHAVQAYAAADHVDAEYAEASYAEDEVDDDTYEDGFDEGYGAADVGYEADDEDDGYDVQSWSEETAQRPAIPVAQPRKVVQKSEPKVMQPSRRAQAEAQPALHFAENAIDYELPPLHLLASAENIERHVLSDEALEENARMLESVLDDYGVKGEIVSVRPGPVVTMYELEPAPGLKASRVIGLADDIARSMSALSARVSTVPGRSVIGIELPNDKREMVSFREILSSRDYDNGTQRLPLALGKDIGGDPVVANLAKMPHLLIAGTTGSGKSVAINTMILSLLYKLTPEDLRLVMIDPKMLELSVYDGIPHLLSPVVTDPKKAVVALKWVVGEMEDRYRKMSKMGVRNIDGYNGRVAEALKKGEMFKRTVQTGFDDETGEPVFETEEFEPRKMPYIVVIVDEMADLMMVAGKEIEACIQRLAQMARASGIHLIMATQRPSVDVITGTIKANFPTRISFQVTSKIDSRTILGEMGAEQLLGMGDMLYMAGGAKITRCHGPFVSDEEVEEVVNHLKAFGPPEYVNGVVQGPDEEKAETIDAVLGLNTGGNTDGEDALYDQAVAIVIKDRKCSTSYIQRKLGIGYNKAARLVEQMEDEGVVSAANHVGKREILVPEQ
ncbi:DNA translocase FtsK [Salipiger mangrovisoli]|uniref:DNA translocase FtsK n=1 Tax=Salipiger mangrovisoli TaxID=2865933 RepID=A0ABR9WXV6_9RHOB|nr:DNA translocase FtsK [Salipiger mangrovisoli]MBE9636135.1 DNA translocase FtsK 4TM domain-containing protein [Salipiger mangrovisoli]